MAIQEAVVLAAGEGKRLRPLTFTRPKCMIQLAGRPILWHVLSNLKAVGVRRAVVVVRYMEKTVREYFAKNDMGMKIEFVTQGPNYGTAAAFAEAAGKIHSTFYAVAGDVISTPRALDQLAREHQGPISAVLTEVEHPEQYGIAQVKEGHLSGFEEKPKNPPARALANCSLYCMEPEIFKALSAVKKSARGEYEMTDVLKSQKVKAIVTSEYWLDMGLPWQLFDANKFLLSQMPEKRGKIENSTIKGNVFMEEGAQIIDSYVEGPLYVGANTMIGPHAYIRGVTSIGADCAIGDSTTVKNSILFDHVNAKHLSYIGDSVIGSGCNFGSATQIANFRFDAGHVKAKVEDVVIDTQRHKLGAIIGDQVKMGVLSSVMPGKMIGDHCWIGANVMVSENVERNTLVELEQKLKKSRIKA
ncbi:MAG: bifunctional sugar-1-phosphate nucleotidylyltransferase/acetyltransferase [Candidatus Micrarchaeota archaeon]